MNIYFMVLAMFDHETLFNNNLNGGSSKHPGCDNSVCLLLLMKTNLMQFTARHSVICTVFCCTVNSRYYTVRHKNSTIFTTARTLSTGNQLTKLLLCYTSLDLCHNLTASLSIRHVFLDVDRQWLLTVVCLHSLVYPCTDKRYKVAHDDHVLTTVCSFYCGSGTVSRLLSAGRSQLNPSRWCLRLSYIAMLMYFTLNGSDNCTVIAPYPCNGPSHVTARLRSCRTYYYYYYYYCHFVFLFACFNAGKRQTKTKRKWHL